MLVHGGGPAPFSLANGHICDGLARSCPVSLQLAKTIGLANKARYGSLAALPLRGGALRRAWDSVHL